MKTTLPEPAVYEFYFPERDTLLQVREADGAVVIRATRDSFSDQRKSCFIRELAAEGFIPDTYRWFSSGRPQAYLGVRWLVDLSWVELPPAALACARRFMLRLLAGGFLLWLVLLATLLHR